MTISSLHLKNISLSFGQRQLFTQLNLTLKAGEWVSLLGPSGIGKTALLRCIAGLQTKTAKFTGEIMADQSSFLQAQVAFLSQTDSLLPWLTVLDNVLLPSRLQSFKQTTYQQIKQRAIILLKQVGLADAITFFPHQLSGGMRQRTALVRMLIENKPIILLDEPFSAVDALTRYQLQNLAAELLQDKTVLCVTHDPIEALRLSHHIFLMQGQPATLRKMAQFATPIPRELTQHEIVKHQAQLFQMLNTSTEAVA